MKNALRAALVASTLGACTEGPAVKPASLCVRYVDYTDQITADDMIYAGNYRHKDWQAIHENVASEVAAVMRNHDVKECEADSKSGDPVRVGVSTRIAGAYGMFFQPVDGPVSNNSMVNIVNTADGDCSFNEFSIWNYSDGAAFAAYVGAQLNATLNCIENTD